MPEVSAARRAACCVVGGPVGVEGVISVVVVSGCWAAG